MLLPFTMTIAGTFPLLLCILLWFIQKKSFSPILGIRLLKCSIFFYLVPIQWIRHLLPANVHDFLYYQNHELQAPKPMLIEFKDKLQIPFFDKYLLIPYSFAIILGITFMIAIIFCTYEIIQYKKHLRYILQTAEISHGNPDRKTKVLIHPYANIPYTIGLFHSYIVFPKDIETIADSSMLYEHEKRHVINKDGMMKLLCLLVLCLHWYNPCAWLLIFFYNIISEYICDIQVTNNYSDDDKKTYASLLISMTSKRDPLPMVWKNNFNNSKNNIKRRITYVMKNKKHTLLHKCFMTLIVSLCLAASCMTVLAYEPLHSTDWIEKPTDDDFMVFIPDASYSSEYHEFTQIDFSKYDTVFISDNGTQIPIFSDNQSKVACNHTYQTGSLISNHKKNSSGGCSYDVYRATVCTKCGHIKSKTYTETISRTVCPH